MLQKEHPIRFEAIPVDPVASLAVRHFQQKSFPFIWHYHPELELTLIVKGRGLRFVGDSIEAYHEGDLCLLGANLPHSWQSPCDGPGVHSICVQFIDGLFGDPFLSLPETRAIRTLLRQTSSRGLLITGKTRAIVSKLVLKIGDERPGSMREIVLLLEMLHELTAHAKDLRPLANIDLAAVASPAEVSQIRQVLDLLHEGFRDVIPSQADIAAKLDMSPGTFSRFFQRCVGKRYIDYLNDWRVGIACRTLLETDEPIIDVALSAGFENLSNFHRRFLSIKGMTPGAYRSLARQSAEANGFSRGNVPRS